MSHHDDHHARTLLRAAGAAHGAAEPELPSTFRLIELHRVWLHAISLFRRYGLGATQPVAGGNVVTYTFSTDALTLRVAPSSAGAPLKLGELRGELRETKGEAGGAVSRVIEVSIATLRWDFPYMGAGRTLPDPAAVCEVSVRAVCAAATRFRLPVIAGGKSMGGRMTTRAAAQAALPGVRGLVLVGFPLRPLRAPKRPAVSRAAHLPAVTRPMLFVQGDRDALAPLRMLRAALAPVEVPTTLAVIAGADHGFARSRRAHPIPATDEIAGVISSWIAQRLLDSATRRAKR